MTPPVAPKTTAAPVLVLTDGDTASASELLSSILRDREAGLLIGGRTYGKGVAQQVFDQAVLPDYFPDGDAMKITSFRLYSAEGTTADTIGVFPHLLVEVDGGVNRDTAPLCRDAGADILVAGTAVFRSADPAGEIAALRG